jgi:DNA-binding NtrC family response regulator
MARENDGGPPAHAGHAPSPLDPKSPGAPGATHALITRPREVTFGRFRLHVVSGPEKGAEKIADAPEIAIGTARGNHLVLTDRAVSRHHCVITWTKEGYLLRDLGSTNGTTAAGLRVKEVYLKSGVLVGAGESSIRFDVLPDELHEPLSDEDKYGRALGQSTAMRRIFALLPRIAASDSTVLLEGETGTGKGLLAEAIHQTSPRAKGPFIVVDCSSIPPTLIETELFGHAKGAFTGAQGARAGAFEAANGGTIFLDELGELRLDMQPKLLRALEERQIRRVGSLDPVRLDVRVIAATNRDLREEVNKGGFRSDLYYRLNIVRIRIPPLRERRDDIPLLVAHFHEQLTRGDASPPADLVEALVRQDWPGNVRELRGAVERAVLMGDPAMWQEANAAPTSARSPDGKADGSFDEGDLELSFRVAKERAVARWERAYVRALVRASEGNLSRAARAARMDRNYLRELLKRHDVSADE